MKASESVAAEQVHVPSGGAGEEKARSTAATPVGEAVQVIREPGLCGGDPVLAGTRIPVHDVISYAQQYDWDLREVQKHELPDLSEHQIRAAVEWYRNHTEEIDAILHARRSEYEDGIRRARSGR
jgi:uncharacterized protein (DUF433 family)